MNIYEPLHQISSWGDTFRDDGCLNLSPFTLLEVEDNMNSSSEDVSLGGAVALSNKYDQGPSRPIDKVQRRLAQNREAARKSRLLKKAYVQQLELSRTKMMQMEQELERLRQKGVYTGDGIDHLSYSGAVNSVQQRMALVEWINSAVPHFYLSVKASDEELRASLLDGDILSQILQRFKYSSVDEGDDSVPSLESRRRKIQRFTAVMSEMGLPSFEITDLEKGSLRPVLDCLLTLKDHTMRNFGSPGNRTLDDRRQALSEIKFQRSYSLLSPESPTMLLHGGNKFQEVFQMKHGLYTDLPATKISEMMKSNILDNAPTQSLLSVINGILDESIERKNAEIPQRVACLLRKVVQEIERRIATQGEHLRTGEGYNPRVTVCTTETGGQSSSSLLGYIFLLVGASSSCLIYW